MSLANQITLLAQSVGAQIKSLRTSVATKAPSQAPSYLTTTHPSVFDQDECTYNWKPSNTRRLRAGLARAATGGTAEILAIGDSLMAGSTKTDGTYQVLSGTRWLDYWQNGLVREGVPKGGTGMVRALAGGFADSRVVYSSGSLVWANNTDSAYCSANGAYVTFTSDQSGDTIDVWAYSFGDAAAFTVSVNGATTGTGFSTQSLSGLPNGWNKFTIATPVLTGQTIVLTKTAGTYFSLLGIQVRNAAAGGLLVHNIAQPGSTAYGTAVTTSWAKSTAASPSLWVDFLNTFTNGKGLVSGTKPSALFLGLGANDLQQTGYSQASTIAAIQTIAGLFTSACDVILVATTQVSPVPDASWNAYVDALHTLADTLDVPLIDQRRLTGTYADAVNAGLTVDGNGHMLPLGNAFLGDPAAPGGGGSVGSGGGNVTRVIADSSGVYPARPTSAVYVEWVGPSEPPNAIDGDTWDDIP